MPLIVHHLALSQSERVVWLCEELGIDYELKRYSRCPMSAPPELTDLHPLGLVPVIQDDDITLAESNTCVEYIAQKHGRGRFVLPPGHRNYTAYLYWFHFVTATLQPALSKRQTLKAMDVVNSPADRFALMEQKFNKDFDDVLDHLNDRLGRSFWLAGDQFTLADIMIVYSLTTVRCFAPVFLGGHKNILIYLARVSARDGYRRAKQKSDPDMDITRLTGATSPRPPITAASTQQIRRELPIHPRPGLYLG